MLYGCADIHRFLELQIALDSVDYPRFAAVKLAWRSVGPPTRLVKKMTHAIVATQDAPSAIGPYSQAILAGQFLFTSGQIAIDPQTSQMVGSDDVATQTEQVMKNLIAVIHAAEFQVTDIVKVTIFLNDMNDFGEVNTIYAEALQGHRPARATVEVSRLPKDALVEIEAICVKHA